MTCWYVKDVGLRRSDTPPVGVAVEIPDSTYRYCLEHYSVLDIGFEDGVFYARLDIKAYRQEALAKLQNPNYITHKGVQYFDDELAYLHEFYYTRSGYRCELTQAQMIQLVTARNRRYSLQRRNIEDAECTEEIDAYMRD